MVRISRAKWPLFVAAFFFVSALLWFWVIAPNLTKLPSNFSFSASIVSTDNFYDSSKREFAGDLYSNTTYRYETISENGGTLVIRNTFDAKTPEGLPIFSVDRLYGVDRYSGAHLPGAGDKVRDGYLFAPKHLSKGENFTYWHVNYDAPAQMLYVREENVHGLRVYRYETYYEGQRIDQTANLGHLPGVGVEKGVELEPHLELWIEPVTGQLIKYKDNTIAYYYDLNSGERLHPWNHFSNTFQEESVEQIVDTAKLKKLWSHVVYRYIPLFLLVVAFLSFLKAVGSFSLASSGDWARSGRNALAVFIIGSGCVVIVGWIVGVREITHLFSDDRGMNFLTAFCFILVGLGIFLKDVRRGRVTSIVGIVVAIITFIRLLGYFGIIPFHIDLLMFAKDPDSLARFGLFTSFSFLLLGLALSGHTHTFMRRLRAVEVTGVTLSLLALLVILGYILEPLKILEVGFFLNVALHTAILLLLCGILLYSSFREREGSTLSPKNIAVLIFLIFVTLSISLGIAGYVNLSFESAARRSFQVEAERVKALIERRVDIYINALDGGRGLFVASQSVGRDEWATYVDALRLSENYPGILGMAYVSLVDRADLASHIAHHRAQGFPEYTVHPQGDRPQYAPVTYIEPLTKGNIRTLGYDILFEKIRRFSAERARDTGDATMTGRIVLVQEDSKMEQPGFLILVPLFKKGYPIGTIEDRRSAIIGYVDAVFRVREFIKGIIGQENFDTISLRINDGTIVHKSTEMYNDRDAKLEPMATPRFITTKTMYVAGRPWTLSFASTHNYGVTTFSRFAPETILLVGAFVSALIAAIFYSLISSRQKAVSYADVVTKDLREAKAKDEAILANIGEGVAVANPGGKLIYWNESAERILGMKLDATPEKDWADTYGVFYPDEKTPMPGEKQALALALRGQTVMSMPEFIRNAGVPSGRHIVVTAHPIHLDDGTFIGAVAVFRDVSRETEVDKAKTEFVSLASHQLRTPLSTVNWYAEMLLAGDAGKISDEQKKYLEEVYTGNQRMVELVNALLNVSRLELGTFVVEPEPTDIAEVIRSVIEEQKVQIDAKKQKMETNFAGDIPTIQADKKLLRMVFQNLLSNAIKYTNDKGSIRLAVSVEGKSVVISVSDNGWGIPKDQHDKIFTKLFRADNVKEQDTEGTGLGLYIVKSIVEQSGGSISFESEKDKGTTFRVLLPRDGMKKKDGEKKLG